MGLARLGLATERGAFGRQVGRAFDARQTRAMFDGHIRADLGEEGIDACCEDLDKALVLCDADGTDVVLAQPAGLAEHRQDAARFGPGGAATVDREPDACAEVGFGARFATFLCRVAQFLGGRMTIFVEAQIGRGDLFGREGCEQLFNAGLFALGHRVGPGAFGEHTLFVAGVDLIGRGRGAEFRRELGALEEAFGLAARFRRHDQGADALAPGAARAARAVQQGFMAVGEFGVHHEVEIGQVNAARRHVGRHADTGAPVAHGLKRVGALGLA